MERQAVLERTQLLELLAQLERPGGELRELEQRTDAIGVDADVPPRTAEVALAREARRRTVAIPGNRRAAEVERPAGRIGHDLHRVGIEQLLHREDRGRERADGRLGARLEERGDLRDERRGNERLIALDIDHDVLARPAACAGDLGDAIGAGGVTRGGEHRLGAEGARGADDPLIVGGDQHLARSRTLGTLVHPLHHGLARDRPQHLSGEPRRGMTRRNDDPEHVAPGLQRSSSGSSAASWRASSSSITGTASRIG